MVVINVLEKGAVGKQLLKDVLKNDTYTNVVAVGRRLVELDKSVPQDKLVGVFAYRFSTLFTKKTGAEDCGFRQSRSSPRCVQECLVSILMSWPLIFTYI